MERNRFHNLLSEIGEDRIIILSTHIVEDVRDLCTNMAIMGKGKVIAQGQPLALIQELQGKIWRKTIEKQDLSQYQTGFQVLSSRLFAGRTQIHVLADTQPDSSFEPIDASLEDVYFSKLA